MSRTMRALGRAVQVGDIVVALGRCGVTEEMVAVACGVSAQVVHGWTRTGGVTPKAERRLRDLREVVLLLGGTLTPKGIDQWLRAGNRCLEGRPILFLKLDCADKVKEAARAYVAGTFV